MTIRKYGNHQSQADYKLFIKQHGSLIIALVVYIDDIALNGNDPVEMSQLKHQLAQEFEIKDLGQLHYFLGIEVSQSKKGIFILKG